MKTFVIGDIHGRRTQLNALLDIIPRNAETDTLVFLGDLIDRGEDAPGVVEDVMALCKADPERVICLSGNHEQMLLHCIENGYGLWFSPATGGEFTFEQYTGVRLSINNGEDFETALKLIKKLVPQEHLDFFRSRPLFYEDNYAIYVHAGLDANKHPRDTDERVLLWSRDNDFFKHYHGKPCVFGHTPTSFLPFFGRIGRHGIYMSHSAIGIDTGYDEHSPLSCLQLPDFYLYQAFPNGHTEKFHITTFIPETLRAMQKAACA